mmetsp:Transcript_6314/g.15158  ORF Transcript_6314/g.15158 Transcript_6314/m.15158 type:complete len:1113 (-) Transcript_6314:141-3479(-)
MAQSVEALPPIGAGVDSSQAATGDLVQKEQRGVRLPEVRFQGQPPPPATIGKQKLQGKSTSLPALKQQPSKRTLRFVERQTQHRSVDMRKQLAEVQRYVMVKSRDVDDVEFWGAQGAKGFRTYLERKFGSIVAGWRFLDQDKNGKLSFYELCNQCRQMGYHGNLKKLWQQLDHDNSGFVSLVKLDEEVGMLVGTFKLELLKRYGDMLTAWQEALDINGSGRIEEEEVVACCRNLGLALDGKKLFACLRSNVGQGMTLHEFDPDAWSRLKSGDLKGWTTKHVSEMEFLADLPEEMLAEIQQVQSEGQNGGARKWRQAILEQEREEKMEEKKKVLKLGLQNVKGFRKAIIHRCGSLFAGWRQALDENCNGRITFGEFCQALSRLGLHGDVKGLWTALGGRKKGYIEFRDLDKETDELLKDLTRKCADHFGNMLLAWLRGFDKGGSGCCSEKQFVKVCTDVGFAGDAQALFRVMQPERARRFLTLQDFDQKAYQAFSRGDFRMLSEKEQEGTEKKPSEMTFMERQQAGFFYQYRKAMDAAKRDEFHRAVGLANIPEHLVDTKDEFENLITRRFGSMICVWRTVLDTDGNGKLTFNEFCAGVRRLGYGGNLKELWGHYSKGTLHISLEDFDKEAFDIIHAYLNLLEERFGNLDEAWSGGFGKDPNETIDIEELRSSCQALNYEGDVKKLFKCLMPYAGKTQITIWDLDPECTRKRQSKAKASVAKPSETQVRRRVGFGNEASVANDLQGPSSQSNLHYHGVSMLEVCRKALRKRYGSTVAAWRVAMDPKGSGRATFGNFMLAMNECCFHGNVKGLWEDLCSEAEQDEEVDDPLLSWSISLKDLDPVAASSLTVLREHLLRRFHCLAEAWYKGFDPVGAERIDEEEFIKVLQKNSVKLQHPGRAFKLLLTRLGQRSIVKDDLQALLLTAPAADRCAILGCTEHDEGVAASGKQATMQEAHAQLDKNMNSLESFKHMLVLKFGSVFSAWRRFLDTDKNGIITQRDFAIACQKLGCKLSRTLWYQLDLDGNGQITLSEAEPEVALMLEQLEKLLVSKYGTCKIGWRKGVDRDNNIRVDLTRFTESLQALGFEGDCASFFKLLQPEPCRHYLTYEDIWEP